MELGNLFFGNSRGNYPVDRDWQENFVEFLSECGFDGYGAISHPRLEPFKKEVSSTMDEPATLFENDVIAILPYYWGDDDAICELPNFVYKPTGFTLSWYKYPFRDSYMNQDLSFDGFLNILEHARNSILINTDYNDEQIQQLEQVIAKKEKELEKLKKKRMRFVEANDRAGKIKK